MIYIRRSSRDKYGMNSPRAHTLDDVETMQVGCGIWVERNNFFFEDFSVRPWEYVKLFDNTWKSDSQARRGKKWVEAILSAREGLQVCEFKFFKLFFFRLFALSDFVSTLACLLYDQCVFLLRKRGEKKAKRKNVFIFSLSLAGAHSRARCCYQKAYIYILYLQNVFVSFSKSVDLKLYESRFSHHEKLFLGNGH